jgi:hypothetical protein
MPDRQRILILYLANSCLASETCAWAEYDGTGRHPYVEPISDDDGDVVDMKAPYASVLEAMLDGWRVIKFPGEQALTSDNAGRTGPLPYEFILEKIETVAETSDARKTPVGAAS